MRVDPARIEEIFGEALTKADAPARAAYLDQACGDDIQLRERVEALLLAHDATGNFLRLPATDEATGPLFNNVSASRSSSEYATGSYKAPQDGPMVVGSSTRTRLASSIQRAASARQRRASSACPRRWWAMARKHQSQARGRNILAALSKHRTDSSNLPAR